MLIVFPLHLVNVTERDNALKIIVQEHDGFKDYSYIGGMVKKFEGENHESK